MPMSGNAHTSSETARDTRSARADSARDDDLIDEMRGASGDPDRDLTDDDRIDILLAMELDTVLPTPPPIPGYHQCWLSEDNRYDTISRRERAGYTPVTPTDLPDWKCDNGTRSPQEADRFRANEMILYKIPERAYQRYMLTVHHKRPLEEEERLQVQVERLVNTVRSRNGKVLLDGNDRIEPDRRLTPTHFQ